MYSLRHLLVPILTLSLSLLTAACSSGGGSSSTPAPGTLTVTVVDGAITPATPIEGALVQVFDAASGNPIGSLVTDANGVVSANYYEAAVQVKVSTQGYAPSPAPGIPPLPVSLTSGQVSATTITLYPLDPALLIGSISGKVLDAQGYAVTGALVTAQDGSGATVASGHSGPLGNYTLYNVPAGDVSVDAWIVGLNFPTKGPITVADGDALTGKNFTASGPANASVSGKVSFTATTGGIVDVTLLQPGSREVVPGLQVDTDANGNYVIHNVPNGTFEIIASLENDGYVLDPDTSVTQGIPTVTVNNNAISRDLKVTGSIVLTNPAASTVVGVLPELSKTPTFKWVKDSSYASADDYVIEVVDESSATVWGGFGPAPTFTPVFTVPQGNNPQVTYNYDGTATVAPLEPGKVYQLRVYARSLDNTATGFTLLSSSETLDGLFRVKLPAP